MCYGRTYQQSLNSSLFALEELIIQKLVVLLQGIDGHLGKQVRTTQSPQGQLLSLINSQLRPEFNPHFCIWVTVGVSLNLSEPRLPLLQNGELNTCLAKFSVYIENTTHAADELNASLK